MVDLEKSKILEAKLINKRNLVSVFGLAVAMGCSVGVISAQAECLETGWSYRGTEMNAAVIATGDITNQVIDGTGCDIAVFFGEGVTAVVSDSKIHGSSWFGGVAYGALVDWYRNEIFDIGDDPVFTGSQHGVAIYCAADSPVRSGGHIRENYIHAFQKNGVVYSGENCSPLTNRLYKFNDNLVLGEGPVDYIAQNGLQASGGAKRIRMKGNKVSGFSYTGPNFASSSGIIIVGGEYFGTGYGYAKKLEVYENDIFGSDYGIAEYNCDAPSCSTPTSKINNKFTDNNIYSPVFVNETGNGDGGYQTGIGAVSRGSTYQNNSICGDGYEGAPPTPDDFKAETDISGANLTIVNNGCGAGDEPEGVESASSRASGPADAVKALQPFQ